MANPELANEVQQLKAQVETLVQSIASLSLQPGRLAGNINGMVRSPTIKFPMFDGSNVDDWLFKCAQFFSVSETDEVTKVTYASMHLEAKALAWHQAFVKNRKEETLLKWNEYEKAIKNRFGNIHEDPMSELLVLKQKGSVQKYHDEFDVLISKLTLQPDYALSCFITGLEDDISLMVRMLKPKTISDAYGLAKLQEASLALHPKPKQKTSFSYPTTSKPPLLPTPSPNTKYQPQKHFPETIKRPFTPHKNPPRYRPFNADFEAKKAQGICFYCDEKFTPQHVCKNKRQLFVLETEEGCEEEEEPEECDEETEPGQIAQISIHALAGQSHCQTMRIPGQVGRKTLSILVDSGSSHNFIDSGMVKKLNLRLEPIPSFNISVANGGKLQCSHQVRNLKWRIRNTDFVADYFVIPLGSCDAVLGIQWLGTLGPITWDFKQLTMEFHFDGKKHVLKGAEPSSLKIQKQMGKTVENGAQLVMVHQQVPGEAEFFAISLNGKGDHSGDVQKLLKTYSLVFEEPRGLPPLREGHDHRIILKPDAEPVSIRPYRYPMVQKDIIESMTQELLEGGVIKHSTSPYASPVVLVKKKDGGWRMCVDYRALNKQTIKDKFPIPLIEELLDELCGSQYYSKIDLRSGFHQIRMRPEDVHKTAFRTHNGHFEYLVMPFGLTNAPSTFQSLMNKVFQPYLRKFVLVFFDDILIYSKGWGEHMEHLRLVLQLMKKNQLYAKPSKCCFGADKLEYLGHIVSKEGVATEPSKIIAVASWPTPKTLKQLRGFLGLTGYYRRFIKGYGIISKPLTNLLKKDAFHWNEGAQRSFEELKKVMTNAPVLALPDFSKPFVIETDASGEGI
ncbi:uncharacterized protein LOC141600986 [Silene latifolia]|uniref:uncharacterized protein LOC141600986 n=1 Tax=Silene latifolia TaxID=37657 RepID=UPI003D77FEEA